jgi:oligopeptide transport system substrate-binding protein
MEENMKKVWMAAAALLLAATVFLGCNRGNSSAAGGESVYRKLYANEVGTLNYLVSTEGNDMEVFGNLVDTLIEYDKYGVVKPALAESWTHNEDYTLWTFKIRPNVKWVDKTGKEVAEVTAADWVVPVQYINEAVNNSALDYMFAGIVKNAEEYLTQSAEKLAAANAVESGDYKTVNDYYAAQGIDPASLNLTPADIGVKALDKYTLQYTMDSPCTFFLSMLSYNAFFPAYGPWLEQYGTGFGRDADSMLYNGAYLLSSFKPQQERVLVKNPAYWDAANVFIERVEFTYNAEAVKIAPTMFTRGELDYALIPSDLLSQWLTNASTKDLVRNTPPDRMWSYFYMFNFEPRFEAMYEPENWLLAVNSENFRQSLFWAMDRVRALTVMDPEDPEVLLNNTITPAEFTDAGGRDYVQYPSLAPITARDSFDAAKALDYKQKAVAEIRAAGGTFPVKVLMPYNPGWANADKESQLLEQQMETLLGTDYIDIIVEQGPDTNFLSVVRRSGKYAFMKCRWGADYADPMTFYEPFNRSDNTYNFMFQDPNYAVAGKPASNKSPAFITVVDQYNSLIDKARSITTDREARYAAFADAEALIINHAVVVPYSIETKGYVVDRLDPFEKQYAPYGVPIYRMKGLKLLDKPMSNTEFQTAIERWKQERAAALDQS